jgi:hypothetical protein
MNDNLANFLRDFAAANSDSFEPDQVQNLVYAANEIENLQADCQKWKQMSMELNDEAKNLRTERDDARMLYCEFVAQDHREGYVDHPEQTPQDVAKSMGWETHDESWGNVTTTQYWCDSCADPIEIGNEFFYSDLPCDIASANKGESGTVCRKCNERLEADYYNDKFRTTDMD